MKKAISRDQFNNFMDTLTESLFDSGFDIDVCPEEVTKWAKDWGPLLLKEVGIAFIKIWDKYDE